MMLWNYKRRGMFLTSKTEEMSMTTSKFSKTFLSLTFLREERLVRITKFSPSCNLQVWACLQTCSAKVISRSRKNCSKALSRIHQIWKEVEIMARVATKRGSISQLGELSLIRVLWSQMTKSTDRMVCVGKTIIQRSLICRQPQSTSTKTCMTTCL